jgi:transposase InsO family protein
MEWEDMMSTNCSVPFTWNNKVYIFVRVEKRKDWARSYARLLNAPGWMNGGYLEVLFLISDKDLFDRQIVGFATGNFINTELCKRALFSAIKRYKPSSGLIHHSD